MDLSRTGRRTALVRPRRLWVAAASRRGVGSGRCATLNRPTGTTAAVKNPLTAEEIGNQRDDRRAKPRCVGTAHRIVIFCRQWLGHQRRAATVGCGRPGQPGERGHIRTMNNGNRRTALRATIRTSEGMVARGDLTCGFTARSTQKYVPIGNILSAICRCHCKCRRKIHDGRGRRCDRRRPGRRQDRVVPARMNTTVIRARAVKIGVRAVVCSAFTRTYISFLLFTDAHNPIRERNPKSRCRSRALKSGAGRQGRWQRRWRRLSGRRRR